MAYSIMEWNSQREGVFLDRYAVKNPRGELMEHTKEEMWNRVARAIGDTPHEIERFYSILKDWRFVPSGRILSGAGTGRQVTYYNCFVLGLKGRDSSKGRDSRQSIMDTITDMIDITSKGGGVGINWSTLRPAGAYISGINGKSSGSHNWMRGADGLADQIRQGGSRTAALMFMLEDWHPDILEFINPGRRFERANFSIGISDAFMQAVINDTHWSLIFPDTSHPSYDERWRGDIREWVDLGLPIKEYLRIPAREIWMKILRGAYDTGSPGVAFLDRCNKQSNTWYAERLVCMNPCGEQPLPESGSCNLGSINLTSFWNPKLSRFDYTSLESTVKEAVIFLDKVIDQGIDINPEIGDIQRNIRRIGLGTMGLADVMILHGIRYGSDESLELIDKIYSCIRDAAYSTSVEISKEKGSAPAFDADKFLEGHFIKTLPEGIREGIRKHGIRNLQLLTQAPTGTISILSGVSSGIEPIFSAHYKRADATGEHYMIHPLFAKGEGDHLVTAYDIPVEDHIKVQSRIQRYVDSSISKTINLHNGSTLKEIDRAFRMAYEMGCKGVTVYRNGSMDDVLIEVKEPTRCSTCSI